MFGAVVLTFVITILLAMNLLLAKILKDQYAEIDFLKKEVAMAKRNAKDLMIKDQKRKEKLSYSRGLYDGRETDILYRQCLKKYLAKDQANVMINGESGEIVDHG